MPECYGDDCSAALVDEHDPGESFSSSLFIDGSENQFYLESFNINSFDSGSSSGDSSVISGRDYSSASSPPFSVTASLSLRISALEDSAGIHQFVLWRVKVCRVVPVLVPLARELLELSVTDSDFCIVHRSKKSYNGVLVRVSSREIKESFVAQRSMLALKGCFIDPAWVSVILVVCLIFNLWCFILLLFCRLLPTGSTGTCSRVAESGLQPGGYPGALCTALMVCYPGATGGFTGVTRGSVMAYP